MQRIALALQPQLKRIEVVLSPALLFSQTIGKELKTLSSRFALFCDETVAEKIGNRWLSHLEHHGLTVSLFTFPSGEQEKSRERKAELEDRLFSHHFGKECGMIALGGGVTTDLIGFLASTFCRGVPLVHVPTTLLGMVDAAIGGKTGVNTPHGKNLIGTLYPADKVLIDSSVLHSLPLEEWTHGCAEIIKYALIRSPSLFKLLQEWRTDPFYLEKVIHTSILIKAEVVETDYDETSGLRRILNFGHTIAHALEKLHNYTLAHGEAVAIGMLVESHMSMKMGLLPKERFDEIESLIRSFPFKLQICSSFSAEEFHSALLYDKKTIGGSPRFVLLEQIGSSCPFAGEYCTKVPSSVLEETIGWMLALFSEGV